MRRTARRHHARRPRRRFFADRRAQAIVLGATCLLGLLVYFKGWDAKPPPILTGRAAVIDGDTIGMSGRQVRLEGIDAPEHDQTCTDPEGRAWDCGKAASRELVARIAGRDLTCKSTDFDRYDRVLAVCSLPDGSDVNAWMVQQGWAVAFGYSRRYASEEANAKAAKRGVWAGTFMRPSEWRERKSD